jgi:alkylation response protein AidB-like acyl-CoA dehydrogenase
VSSTADAETRQGVADAYIRNVIAEALPASLESEPEPISSFGASIVKLFCTDTNRRLADTAAALIGPAIAADTGQWGTFAWSRVLLGVPATRIAGGTDEIQRNILAERVLGLPRDPRP